MAAPDHQDPLILLRYSIASKLPFVPIASEDASAPECPLARATHLRFAEPALAVALETPTRFISNDAPVDLRSIYFAWLNREVAIPEYNASATALNDELAAAPGTKGGKVQNLGFIERLDLITWLEGVGDDSEYIKPLNSDADPAGAHRVAQAAKTGAAASATQARSGKGTMDPRVSSVHGGERRMGDRNTVLRGIKPTDFSHVRKLAAPFLLKKPQSATGTGISSAVSQTPKTQSRRPDPIILLSPSASSLLRMSNARSFLEDGKFVPPDVGASTASMLHVQRTIKSIDPNRPMRFILVEGSEQFKPEYWNRVVAVFTTGQTWQFKNYKWSTPNDLFRHTLGIYVGWRGEQPPETIKSWGHRVLASGVDRWRGEGHEASRFRDKEVVEHIWKSIEGNMNGKGWRRDAAPSSI
jgi:parafibromin